MQLRHVHYFVAVADHGTVSAAATAVHVTQPALSRQLRQLEHDLGVDLFDRAAGRLSLNRTGRELLPVARDLLATADTLQDAATFHARGRVERLTIAAPTATLTDVVGPFVASMAPDDPVVDVVVSDGLDTGEALAAGADLAIGTRRPQPPARARVLATLPVWAYVRPDDPWAARHRVPLAELLARPLVALPATFTAREALDAAVQDAAGTYAEIIEAANGTLAQALAASGRGVAVVSDDPRFDLVPLAIDVGRRQLSIRLIAAWDGRSVTAPTMSTLARRIGTWVEERYGVLDPAR